VSLKRTLAWAIVSVPLSAAIVGFVWTIIEEEGLTGLGMAAAVLSGIVALSWAVYELSEV
jgi:hypothetical protein